MFKKLLNFKSRKIVHYSLIICILLIQLLIAGFFYNEYINRKNLTFIENQLKDIHSLENLTNNSRNELLNAQGYFQSYAINKDEKDLNSYFQSLGKLGGKLDSINNYRDKYPRLKNILSSKKKDAPEIKKLKVLIDSTYHFSMQPQFKTNYDIPKLEKYIPDYNFDKFDVETKTFTDTVKKKGLFGRLGDAISGKENVRKDSTVVTVKQGKKPVSLLIKSDFDSIMKLVNNHYYKEIKKIQIHTADNATKKKDNDDEVYKMFGNLLIYSNGLMNVYEVAIKDSKADLEKEYNKQNSESNKIRKQLIF